MLPGQTTLPGAEPITDGELLARRSAQPLRPAKPQRRCDVGLFSDDRDQLDLISILKGQQP